MSVQGAVFVFGGESSAGKGDIIAKFSNEKWYKIGVLHEKRSGLKAFLNEDHVLLVGGVSDSSNKRFDNLIAIIQNIIISFFEILFLIISCYFRSKTELWTIGSNKSIISSHVMDNVLDFILMPIAAESCDH